MSTKEHRLSNLCAKQAFLPVSPANRSGLKAALGAQAKMLVFGDSRYSRMKINGCRSKTLG